MPGASPLVFTFTDFGAHGPYLAQMAAAVLAELPDTHVLDLLNDAPMADPRASAYLLAALVAQLPPRSVVLAVVDPGVGTARHPLLVEADGRLLLGPDNGLLSRVVAAAAKAEVARIDWRPARLAPSFHGRDLFAPAAARLAAGRTLPRSAVDPAVMVGTDWPGELAEIIYFDHYGNAYTGLAGRPDRSGRELCLADRRLPHAAVFGAVPPGAGLWYVNSCGLVEIAVNRGNAAAQYGLRMGDPVAFCDDRSTPGSKAPRS